MERTENINQQQPLFLSFDEILPQDSMARVIDRFVSVCDLQQMGFQAIGSKETGRPAYSADGLSRLYVYGYCNGIRSSRKLKNECIRNIEVIWLTGGQRPSHKTIAEFRKNNVRPLQKLFHRTVTRNQYAEVYEEVDKCTRENMHLYKLRRQILEHPFGTIKFGLQGYYFFVENATKV